KDLMEEFEGYVAQMYAKYAPQNTPSPEQMVTLRQQFLPFQQQSQQPLGLGGEVMSAVSGINRGFYKNLISTPLKFIGQLATAGNRVPDRLAWNPATAAGEAVERFIDRYNPVDPRANETVGSIAEGVGQGASMMLGGALGRGAQAVPQMAPATGLVPAAGRALGEVRGAMTSPAGVLGSMAVAVPEFEAAKEAGLSDDEALTTALKNYLVGSTEAIPIANLFGRLNQATGNRFVNLLKTSTAGSIEEFFQEGIQTYLTNQIARADYDPSRDPMFSVLESALVGG